jgi:two-component system, LytTR family, response regulator
MRCLLIDDEAAARSRLSRLLLEHPEVVVVGEAQDGLDAVTQIETLHPDLLFLDIEMPGLTGFEVLQAIPAGVQMPLVIFVTGYDQHALAAFEANALAYLLKPVEPDRLAQAIERASRLHTRADERDTHERDTERANLLRAAHASPSPLRHIVCRKRDRLTLVPPEQILWFEVKDGIVRARTAADSFWVNYQLVDLESALPEGLFFRARREALVNVTKIKEIKPYFRSGFLLVMADTASTEIVVSERQVRPLRERFPGL